MNPNFIHWRRIENLQQETALPERSNSDSAEPPSPNRPPSYVTEDGVRYMLDEQPKFASPGTNSEVLPLHPSERGRIALETL
jgi:hypothetical protein